MRKKMNRKQVIATEVHAKEKQVWHEGKKYQTNQED